MTKLYIAVGEYGSDANIPSEIIGIFTTLALAIEASVSCHRLKWIRSWYIDEIKADYVGAREIVLTKATFDSALKGGEKNP